MVLLHYRTICNSTKYCSLLDRAFENMNFEYYKPYSQINIKEVMNLLRLRAFSNYDFGNGNWLAEMFVLFT